MPRNVPRNTKSEGLNCYQLRILSITILFCQYYVLFKFKNIHITFIIYEFNTRPKEYVLSYKFTFKSS